MSNIKNDKNSICKQRRIFKSIFEYLNEKTLNDIKEICKEFNIKSKNMISIVYYLSKSII